jgi:RNA polymerase sigma-70 factor, ECF subfamily
VRLVRAKRKIKAAAIPYRVPEDHELPGRVPSVLRVVYLVFTEGHRASAGDRLINDELCDEAIRLARLLAGLCPDDPEALGLLALLLLTDPRRAARTTESGRLVLLSGQERGRWGRAKIGMGNEVLDRAIRPPAAERDFLAGQLAGLRPHGQEAWSERWPGTTSPDS